MKKKQDKDFEDEIEEIDEDVIEDIDDDIVEDIDDDDIEDLDNDEEKPKKNIKPKQKKKKKTGLIIGIVAGVLVIAIAVVACGYFFLGWFNDGSTTGDLISVDKINYSLMLENYETAPTSAVTSSIKYDWTSVLSDSSKTNAYKAASAVLFTTGNEIFVNQYSFFRYQVGKTSLGDKSGSMVYQRVRRETTDVKYDTTIKLPVNDNFGTTERAFVTGAAIRYVANNYYHRFKNNTDIVYNTKTGLLEVSEWTKNSSSTWHQDGQTNNTLSEYSDMKKIQANVGTIGETIAASTVNASIIKNSTVTIEDKDGYYSIYFEIDTSVANADKTTTDALNNDNSGKGITYDYCKVTIEVWDCGLAKSMSIDESWSGQVGAAIIWYQGSASAESRIKYSYSTKDCCDDSYPASLVSAQCKDCA